MPISNVWIISKYATPNKYPRHFGIGKDLVSKGIEVTLIASVSNSVAKNDVPNFKGWCKKEDHNGLSVIWMNGPSISNTGFLRIFSWFWFEFKVLTSLFFSKQKPTTIIVSSLSLLSVWSGVLLSIKYKARLIFEVRDIWPLSLVELGGYSNRNLFIRFLRYTEILGYEKAECIIGTMPNLKEHVLNSLPSASKKVICIPQGVYLDVFENNSELLNECYIDENIPKEKFIVAYTGTLNSNNPIGAMFEAARKLEKEFKNIHFLVLGDGTKKQEYQEATKGLSNVSFPPPISKRQMAHFLTFVNIGYDSFSSVLGVYGLSRNKWIDYMYNRCIVICSFNGFKSMINESHSGFFVPYNDPLALAECIIKIYKMPRNRIIEMQENGRDFIINNRTFDKLGDSYFNVINPKVDDNLK